MSYPCFYIQAMTMTSKLFEWIQRPIKGASVYVARLSVTWINVIFWLSFCSLRISFSLTHTHTHICASFYLSSSIHLYFSLVFLHEMIHLEKQTQGPKPFSASSPLICQFYLSLHPLFKLSVNVQPTFNCHLSSCQQAQSQVQHVLKHTHRNATHISHNIFHKYTCTQTKMCIGKSSS